ncbi:MAG: DHHA1 domain-containing protein, partial [Candidatus Zipacnadales bacterium]
VSAELCGGTHSPSTGTIGSFRILSESSAAANVRRIEAVVGMAAVHRARSREALLVKAAHVLGCPVEELPQRIESLRAQLVEARQAAARIATSGTVDIRRLLAEAQEIGPARLVVYRLDGAPQEALKSLVDDLVARGEAVVALVASVDEAGTVRLCAKADEKIVQQGAHAGHLVKTVATACGGGGGGKPTFAQAGARDATKLEEALATVPQVLAAQLGV